MNRPGPNAAPARTVACPRCGAPASFDSGNPWRPFCSERCKTIDLGAWASESYRVPGPDEAPADDGPASQ